MGEDNSGPAPDAVTFNDRFRNTNDAYLLKVRATFSLPLENVSDDALSQAIFNYQQQNSLGADGKLNQETVDRLNGVNRIGSADWAADLDARDTQALQAAIDQAAAVKDAPNVTPDQLRDNIINLATSQIGTVHSANRGDNKMYGGRRVIKYCTVFGGQLDENRLVAPGFPQVNWCGIFAVWSTNYAAAKGWWALGKNGGQPFGLDEVPVSRGDRSWLDQIQKGDLLAVAEFQHQFLFVGRDGDELTTIDGNGDWQMIRRFTGKHRIEDIVAYFPTVR